MGRAEMYRTGNFTATGTRAGLILMFSVLARSASAQSRDTTGADTSKVKQLQTITVTAERPRAAAPPVTTLVVPAAELRRTFANNPYDLLRRTSGIEVHEQGQGPGFASDAVIRGFSSDHSSDVRRIVNDIAEREADEQVDERHLRQLGEDAPPIFRRYQSAITQWKYQTCSDHSEQSAGCSHRMHGRMEVTREVSHDPCHQKQDQVAPGSIKLLHL